MKQTWCIQEGFECLKLKGGSGAAGRFYKGDTFACVQPRDVLAVVFMCRQNH